MRLTNSPEANQATKSNRFVASSFMALLRDKGRQALLALLLVGATPLALAGAGTWTISSESPSSINAIAMDPYVPSQIVVSFGSGFARTADSGNSWEKEVHGADPTMGKIDTLPGFPSTTLVRLPSNTNILFSGKSDGYLYRTATNATQPSWPTMVGDEPLTLPSPLYKTWDRVDINASSGAIVGTIYALAAHPRLANLAVSVQGSGIFVLASNNSALNANAASTCVVSQLDPLTISTVVDVYTYADAVPATNSVTITRTATTGSSPTVSIATSGTFSITNSATLLTNFGAAPAVPTAPTTNPAIAFLAPTTATSTTSKHFFCKPSFPNQTFGWTAGTTVQNSAAPNVNTQIPYGSNAMALVFDPTLAADKFLYAGLDGKGIYYSANKGGTWLQDAGSTPSSSTPQNVSALLATQSGGTTVLYAATTGSGAGVYKGIVAYDNAATPTTATITWSKLPTTLPGQTDSRGLSNIRALAADPITPTKIYAGTFGYGVYSIDTSASSPIWSDISNGLYATNASALYVTSLQVDPLNPARVYAGTYGGFFTYEQVSTPKASINISTTSPLLFNSSTLQQSITLTNSGVVPLTFSGAIASGKFSVNTSCPPSLAVGSSCTLTIQYQPATASDNGSLSIATDDPASPIIVALSGSSGSSSSTSAPVLSLSPSTLAQFTTANSLQTIKLTNSGTAPLLISGTVATGSFTPTSSCPTSLNPNSSCSILLEYKPTTTASENSLLVITSNDPASPAQIALNGVPDSSGSSGTSGAVSATPSSLGFAGVPVNMQSATRSVTLKNTSSQAVSISNVIVDNPAFIVDNSQCPNQLAALASCNLLLAYTPTDDQAVTAALKVTIGGNTLLTITLTGSSADQTTMTGTTYGSATSLTLTGNFFFSSREKTGTGNLYVGAFLNGQWFFFDGFAWQPWLTGSPRAYGPTATYASKSLTVFNRVDISQLKGAQFFLAYGSKYSDVARNLTYSLIYTAP
jgi:hypothetical protein